MSDFMTDSTVAYLSLNEKFGSDIKEVETETMSCCMAGWGNCLRCRVERGLASDFGEEGGERCRLEDGC